MIPALSPRLALAALPLFALASVAAAQDDAKQRSRTLPEPKRQEAPAQPGQQRAASSAAQPKGAPPAANQPKGSASPSAKPAPAGTGKPAATSGPPAGPGGGKPALVASFADWSVFAMGEGRTRSCYAMSQPKERLPKDLKRDPAYLFVSFRPADNVRNEVAIVMGFATRDGAPAEAVVGQTSYALVTKGSDAWISNRAEESQVIATFSKGQSVTVKATSGRGNPTSDLYSLNGFVQALDRTRKECS
jgi:hypothetical protein